MVDFVREREGGNLRDLAPEPEANVAEIADKILGNRGEAVVYAAPSEFREYWRVLRRVKVFEKSNTRT